MKLIGCILALTLVSCGIKEDIRNEVRRASLKCEQRIDEKIAEIEEKYEDYCISKEDFLTVLRALQEGKTVRIVPKDEVDAGHELPEVPPFPGGFQKNIQTINCYMVFVMKIKTNYSISDEVYFVENEKTKNKGYKK